VQYSAPEASRTAGLRRLADFIASAGGDYRRTRNFDFGPERRTNVSVLSPYVRHRLVLEQELIEAAAAQHGSRASSKFIEEVFWRSYFKGWLQQHPLVWHQYRAAVASALQAMEDRPEQLDRYLRATGAESGIDCFDAWVSELKETGYLHNHARMWFASIWVYTLDLPWQLGADFFYRHLLDGDPASNTVSWRWVCGLHTSGKTYLARVSNIVNYTDGRFNPHGQLATSAPPLLEPGTVPTQPLAIAPASVKESNFGLLITEDDCNAESLPDLGTPAAVMGVVATRGRSPLPVSDHVRGFAAGAVADAVGRCARRFSIDGQMIESANLGDELSTWAERNRINTIVTPYVPVGPVADLLGSAHGELESRGIGLVTVRRAYDTLVWPHAKQGFFRLKKQIPAILEALGIEETYRESPSVDEQVPCVRPSESQYENNRQRYPSSRGGKRSNREIMV
jgi:deoxyribodipyrimidine photo-lyase